MTFTFRPAKHINDAAGLFVSLTGPTNSGKSFTALTLARGIAGPHGKIAVLDTEGGRTLNLKDKFDFDAHVMGPPFHPAKFAEAAEEAEAAGYSAMLIDSWSMEWAGAGGVLDWIERELTRMAGDDYGKRERMKFTAMIKPKSAHRDMVNSLLQRRMPIIFSIRGADGIKPSTSGGAPEKVFKAVCSPTFPFELTVAFRLASDRKGYVDLSDPKTWKMEEGHLAIFKDGDRIEQRHGAALKQWSIDVRAASPAEEPADAKLTAEGFDAAERGSHVLKTFWARLTPSDKKAAGGAAALERWKATAAEADVAIAAEAAAEGAAA